MNKTEEFIKKANTKHGDTYYYSKVEYKKSSENVIIICKIHGEFPQLPPNHLKGYGCKKCGTERTANNCRSNTNEFIEKAILKHGDLYDYSKVEYKKSNDYVIIICKTHGEFLQTPQKHLCGGCIKCGFLCITSDKSIFVNKSTEIHDDIYDYSKSVYINNNTNLIIICKIHGEFYQRPRVHLSGRGCSMCCNKTEAKLYEQIKKIYPSIITQFKQEWCKNITYLPFDFCIMEYNIIIELDGPQHFRQVMNWKSPEITFETDKYKENCANDNGYSIIRIIQEDVWNDSYDWYKDLNDTIQEIITCKTVINRYLCKNNEYDKFLV